jgi:nitroreductase
MQTWEAIRSRRNVRSFADSPISESDIDQILEAGRRSPSSRNWQPWDFVLITERERLRKLATVWRGAGHVAESAATVAMIAPAEADELGRAQYDLGQATMSIMLAAADLGIGSCHSAVGDQELARAILGLPQQKVCAFLISLGYPAGRLLAPIGVPDRRPFDQVVHRGGW